MAVLSAVVLTRMATVAMVVVTVAAVVVLTGVARYALVGRALSMMKRPSVVVGYMIMALAVVKSRRVMGPT